MKEWHVIDCEGPGDFEVEAENYKQALIQALGRLGFVVKSDEEYKEITGE